MKAAAVTSDIAYLFILIYIFILFKKETKIPLKPMFSVPKEYFLAIKDDLSKDIKAIRKH